MIKVHGQTVRMVAVDDLRPFERNARDHPEAQVALLAKVIGDSGFTQPLIVDADLSIIAGHGRLLAAKRLGMPQVPCVVVEGLTAEQVRALRVSDNQTALLATWDVDLLRVEMAELGDLGFDLSLTGFPDLSALDALLPPAPRSNPGAGSLAEQFGVPPFSVLNAREGWWQDRKRAWIGLGIRSELGRGEEATYGSEHVDEPGLNNYRNGRALAAHNNEGLTRGAGGLSAQAAAKATARNVSKAVRLPTTKGRLTQAMVAGVGTKRGDSGKA